MDIKVIIAQWVRTARTTAKLSGEELGAKLALNLKAERGHSKGNISHWELGKHQPNIEQLLAISKITGVPLPSEIFGTPPHLVKTGEGSGQALPENYNLVTAVDPDHVEIRKVKLKLSAGVAGFTTELADDCGRPINFRRDWLNKKGYSPEKLVAIDVKGDNMEPTMSDGDTVVINTADVAPKHSETFAVNYEGEDIVRRMSRDAGRWFLSSDNPDQLRHQRQECIADTCIIIGKVIFLQRENI